MILTKSNQLKKQTYCIWILLSLAQAKGEELNGAMDAYIGLVRYHAASKLPTDWIDGKNIWIWLLIAKKGPLEQND